MPSDCWKIILILDDGENDFYRITEDTEIIAVFIPNEQGVQNNGSWDSYLTTVDFIEEQTGYDFLYNIPDEIEDIIESRIYSY